MKGTEQFQTTIQNYLDARAAGDPLFAETLKKKNKSINECIKYILSEVQKSGCNGFADEEIFGMAVHYYDEDDLKVKSDVKAPRVVVNHTPELSAEEKEEARKVAFERAVQEQQEKLRKQKPAQKKSASSAAQEPVMTTLFD